MACLKFSLNWYLFSTKNEPLLGQNMQKFFLPDQEIIVIFICGIFRNVARVPIKLFSNVVQLPSKLCSNSRILKMITSDFSYKLEITSLRYLLRPAETRWDSLRLAETRWDLLRLTETRWDSLRLRGPLCTSRELNSKKRNKWGSTK